MNIKNKIKLYDTYTDKIVISRFQPFITDLRTPSNLIASFTAIVECNVSLPGAETEVKKILNLEDHLLTINEFTVEVQSEDSGKNIQLFSAHSKVVHIFTCNADIFPDVKERPELLGEFIANHSLPAAWAHWRAQMGVSIAACSLPVPHIPAVPPDEILDQYRQPA